MLVQFPFLRLLGRMSKFSFSLINTLWILMYFAYFYSVMLFCSLLVTSYKVKIFLHIRCSGSMSTPCSLFSPQFGCHSSQLSCLASSLQGECSYLCSTLNAYIVVVQLTFFFCACLAVNRRTDGSPCRIVHPSCPGAPAGETQGNLKSSPSWFHNLQPTGGPFSSSSHGSTLWVAIARGNESMLFAIASSIPTQCGPELNTCVLKERKEKAKKKQY